MVKMSSFIIGIILISGIIAIFGVFMSHIGIKYSVHYDNETLDDYQQLSAINSQVEDIRNETKNIQEKQGILDIIGGYFSSAWKVVKLTGNSYDTFDNMGNAALNDIDAGESAAYLKTMLTGIVLVLIFLGVLVSAIMKWKI